MYRLVALSFVISDILVLGISSEYWPLLTSIIIQTISSFWVFIKTHTPERSLAALIMLGLIVIQLGALAGLVSATSHLVQTLLVIGTIDFCGMVLFTVSAFKLDILFKWLLITAAIIGSVGVGILFLGPEKQIGVILVIVRIAVASMVIVYAGIRSKW